MQWFLNSYLPIFGRPKYICIHICLKSRIRIYLYLTQINLYLYLQEKNWQKYICIHIRAGKPRLSNTATAIFLKNISMKQQGWTCTVFWPSVTHLIQNLYKLQTYVSTVIAHSCIRLKKFYTLYLDEGCWQILVIRRGLRI